MEKMNSFLPCFKNPATRIEHLLCCIKDFIQSEIVNDIQNQTEGPFFGISADEVADMSDWQQLEIVVHYARNCQAIENY